MSIYLALAVSSAAFGYLGNLFAKRTGRNPELWTILGLGLGVFVLAAMLTAEQRSPKEKRFFT